MFSNTYNFIDEVPFEEIKREYRTWIFDIKRGRYTLLNVWDPNSKRILNNEFAKMYRDGKLNETELTNIVNSYVAYIDRLKVPVDQIPVEFRELVQVVLDNQE